MKALIRYNSSICADGTIRIEIMPYGFVTYAVDEKDIETAIFEALLSFNAQMYGMTDCSLN